MAGAGIWDVTGPAAEVNMMGYANLPQTTAGIHLRLRARAFVFKGASGNKVAFVSVDAGMASTEVTRGVVEALQQKYGADGPWSYATILISGTHTHSGPGGFFQYLLYEFTSLGQVKETVNAFVEGIVKAIEAADAKAVPARASIISDLLFDANINRSPTSYLRNPAGERERWAAEGDTDKMMTLLRIDTADVDGATPLGVVNWFAVHCTSMNNTNQLISGDNKGYAGYLFERDLNGPDVAAGQGEFVASFAQSNLGDVSPNTRGASCQDTGLPCDGLHSTCNGKNELCVASGPGNDMFESTQIIGAKQYAFAKTLWANASGAGDFVFGAAKGDLLLCTADVNISCESC